MGKPFYVITVEFMNYYSKFKGWLYKIGNKGLLKILHIFHRGIKDCFVWQGWGSGSPDGLVRVELCPFLPHNSIFFNEIMKLGCLNVVENRKCGKLSKKFVNSSEIVEALVATFSDN